MKSITLLFSCLCLVAPIQAANILTDTGSSSWTGPISFTAPAADVTAPTVVSVTVLDNGTNVSISLTENVSPGTDGHTGFAATLSGGAVTLTWMSGQNPLVYSANRTIWDHETGTMAFTQPGDGYKDGGGNLLATFASQAIVNSSTNTMPLTYLVSESFGPNAAWTESDASIDQNHTGTILSGAASCYLPNAGGLIYAYTNLPASTEYYMYFEIAVTNWLVSKVTLSRVGVADDFEVKFGTEGQLSATHGYSGTASGTFSTATKYHVWAYWKKATYGQSNGLYWASISTTAEKPAPLFSESDGTSTNQPTSITIQGNGSALVVDKIRVATTAIGSNPD